MKFVCPVDCACHAPNVEVVVCTYCPCVKWTPHARGAEKSKVLEALAGRPKPPRRPRPGSG